MIVITFPDKETQTAALGFLLGRFSGTVLKSGEHIVPEAALKALADRNFVFTVQGKVNEEEVASLRNSAAAAVQRRRRRAKSVATDRMNAAITSATRTKNQIIKSPTWPRRF